MVKVLFPLFLRYDCRDGSFCCLAKILSLLYYRFLQKKDNTNIIVRLHDKNNLEMV